MANYYLKLHFDIIHDPKMCRLPDRLYRRVIELFVLAGKEENHGHLPSIAEMAWELRINEADLLDDLRDIHARTKKDDEPNPEVTGIVHEEEYGRWVVTNFAKRQASKDPTAQNRMVRYRERVTDRNNSETVTRNVTRNKTGKLRVELKQELNKELKQEQENPAAAAVFTLYENEISLLTPMTSEKISAWIDDYPEAWVIDAIGEAVINNVRKPAYIDKILRTWQSEGRTNGKKPYRPEDYATEVYT